MNKEINYNKSTKYTYYIGMVLGIIASIGIILVRAYGIELSRLLPACEFYTRTGYYCFGCGNTRAITYFIHGNLIKSFMYNPVILYIVGIYIIYMVSNTLNIYVNNKIRAMKFKPIYLYICAIIIIVQCIVKNVLLMYGIDYFQCIDNLI